MNQVLIYPFTFHYGSILIDSDVITPSYYFIYIPLWFYSNIFWKFIFCGFYIFTFHYGSILILELAKQLFGNNIFTFHYGSILI